MDFASSLSFHLEDLVLAASWNGPLILCLVTSGCLFLAGASVASFSGLVADRLPGILAFDDEDKRTLNGPPSSCDGCGKKIPVTALIPVFGWIIHRGRCTCAFKVSPIYPSVEALIGLLTALAPIVIGDPSKAGAIIMLLWAGTVLTWCDLRHHILPEQITFPLLFIGLLCSPFEADPWMRSAGAALAAGMIWFTFLIVTRLRGENAVSFGDVMFLAAVGAWLGLYNVPITLLFACIAFVFYALPLRRHGVEWVPMGPAIAISALAISVMS